MVYGQAVRQGWGLLAGNSLGGIDAVEGGRSDAAGIACTLSARVEVGRGDGLECVGVARYADCTTAAAFHAEDNGFVGEEPAILAVEVAETLLQACANHGWQPLIQSAAAQSGQVTAWGEVAALSSLYKVTQALGGCHGRRCSVQECLVLKPLLKVERVEC